MQRRYTRKICNLLLSPTLLLPRSSHLHTLHTNMSKSLFSLWIIATLAFLASSAAAGGPQGQNPRPAYLWEITQPLEQDGSGEGLVEVNQNVVAKAKANIRNEGHDELVLEVFPGEFLTCTMKNMDGLLHPDLASNFPQIATLSGHCDDDMTTVLITFNDNLKNSIAVTIHFEGRMLFFADYDSAVSGNPQTLRLRIPQFDPNLDWTDEVIESPEADIGIGVRKLLRAPQFNGRRLNTEATARKFRIAIVATKEFSAARGGTRDAVLTAIVNIMARVNGIFLKELGVMFELIPESGNLVCIAGDSGCNELANDTGIWSQFVSFVGTRGVSSSDYDIGHSFGTLTSALSASGVAARPSLCTSFKHNGLSRFGNSFPFNDSLFFLVTHEIAHQVNGPHSCKCTKHDTPFFRIASLTVML